jgi:hypothetical protein
VRPPDDSALLLEAIATWRDHYQHSFLFYVDYPEGGLVADARGSREPRIYPISALALAVLIGCAEPRARSSLRSELSAAGSSLTAERLDETLDQLDELGLIYQEDERVVALAIRWRDYVPPEQGEKDFRLLKHQRAHDLFHLSPLCSTDLAAAAWR